MHNFFNAKIVHYFLLTLTIQVTFIYMNAVFFIYKYKQLFDTMPSKFNVYHLPFLILPTLAYYITRYLLANSVLQPIVKLNSATKFLFLTAIYIKGISYILDAYLTICVELASFLLITMNFMIAYIDSYLLSILENIYTEDISSNTIIAILLEEIPNYLFAFTFGILESLVYKSCRPYFDIVALLYLVLALYYTLYEQKLCVQNTTCVVKKDSNSKLYKNKIVVIKILCTISETLIYFFLMSTMKDQNFLVMYFSFEFVFKIVKYTPQKEHICGFLIFKFFVMFLTLYYVLTMKTTTDYTLTVLLFITNGITNRLVHRCFEKLKLMEKETLYTEMIVFVFVSFFVIFFAQKEDETFEDFIFFSSVRL